MCVRFGSVRFGSVLVVLVSPWQGTITARLFLCDVLCRGACLDVEFFFLICRESVNVCVFFSLALVLSWMVFVFVFVYVFVFFSC